MLAVMAIPLPITAFEYCMTLAGPVGVLVAPAAAFQVSFMVTLVLALLGQGGFTVVGLNTLVLALGAVVARPVYRSWVGVLGPARAMGFATAVSQLASTVCWGLVLALSVRLAPATADGHEMSHTVVGLMRGAGALVVVPMLLLAVAVEALLGAGLGGFLARVRPDLLPRTGEGA
jgi:cobalt/nickel transport system permease protein